MPYYRSLGDITRKRHIQFRKPDGTLYHEELMGEEGFSDDSALLYHLSARSLFQAYFSCSTSEALEDLTALELLEVAHT